MLEAYLKERLREKPILLMTHIVAGYPSFETAMDLAREMVKAGADLMELQIPFSEPIVDGPVISRANQAALKEGATVEKCLAFAARAAGEFQIPFLIMTYCDNVFRYGVSAFVEKMAKSNLKGAIIPDLPPEEGKEYLNAMRVHGLSPVLIFSPDTSEKRMGYLSGFAGGFVYCVARKGVTGARTEFGDDLAQYIAKCRGATSLPLAVGFGVSHQNHVNYLKGKADIAVIGTQSLRILEKEGVEAVGRFISGLRP